MKNLYTVHNLLVRDVIYTSRAYAIMPVRLSVCLWPLCTVVTGCDGSRMSLHAWIVGCLYYLLTTPDPDRRMGWCWDFWWGYGKSGNCSDIAYFTYFLSMDRNHVTYLFTWMILKLFSVISVENALCQKTVQLITTSALNSATSYIYCRRIKRVTEFA